jgi:hypothetical protein
MQVERLGLTTVQFIDSKPALPSVRTQIKRVWQPVRTGVGSNANNAFSNAASSLRRFAGRGKEELIFFCFHGHWPEQACADQPCRKARSDEIVSQYETRNASKTE